MNTLGNRYRRFSGIALAMGLLSLIAPARAEVVNLTVAADGQVSRNAPTDPFLLDTAGTGIEVRFTTRAFNGNPIFLEQRGLFAFDLSPIPAGSTITSVSFTGFQYSAGGDVAQGERTVEFFGYSGNGILSVADAEAGTPVTVFSGAITNHTLFSRTVSLDPSFVQSALDAGAFATLNLRLPESFDATLEIAAQENPDRPAPSLQVAYSLANVAAPEPASLALLALSGLPLVGVVARRQRSRRTVLR